MLRAAHSLLCYTFVAVFLLGGLGFALVMPPFQGPDEAAHWSTATRMFDSMFIRTASPCTMTAALAEYFHADKISHNAAAKQPTGLFSELAAMQPSCQKADSGYTGRLSYPGTFLAKLLFQNAALRPTTALVCFYVARVLGGLMLGLILVRCLTLLLEPGATPIGLAAFAFCLSPLFLQQSFTVTADFVVNAFALFAFATCLTLHRCKWLDVALFILLGAAAVTTKPTVAPFLLLPFLAFIPHFARTERKLNPRVALLLGSCAPLLALAAYATLAAKNVIAAQGNGIDASLQLRNLINEPLSTLKILTAAVLHVLRPDSMAAPLGWLDTSITTTTATLWRRLFFLCCIFEIAYASILGYTRLRALSKNGALKTLATALCKLGAITSVVAVFAIACSLAMYLAWTPVGATEVRGLQSRYFFPLYLAAALFIPHILALDFDQTAPSASPMLSVKRQLLSRWQLSALGLSTSFFGYYLLNLYYSLAIRFW